MSCICCSVQVVQACLVEAGPNTGVSQVVISTSQVNVTIPFNASDVAVSGESVICGVTTDEDTYNTWLAEPNGKDITSCAWQMEAGVWGRGGGREGEGEGGRGLADEGKGPVPRNPTLEP